MTNTFYGILPSLSNHRRRHEKRWPAPDGSCCELLKKCGEPVCGFLVDISRSGAGIIVPDGTAKIKCGELLTSLTLELKQRISGSDHVTVTIPMATVAWVKDNDDKKMLGLKFCENIGRNNLSYRNNLQAGQDNPAIPASQ